MLSRALPRTDPADVQQLIEAFAALSDPADTIGITRPGYSRLERDAHALFARFMTGVGLVTRTDAAGNTHAVLRTPGQHAAGLPYLGTGSHLDSVPCGGRFDGIVGVVAGMLAARALAAADPLRHPLDVLVFANEEGARFGQACNGSRALAGALAGADLDRLHDHDGVTLRQAMTAAGLRPDEIGSARLHPDEWEAFVETHIEQGSVLADTGAQVGIVSVISGSTRTTLTWRGVPSHSGGTPMASRSDALVAAARVVLRARDDAADPSRAGLRATVGRLDVRPDSVTTIPGRVEMTIDVRDVRFDRQQAAAAAIVQYARQVAAEERVELTVTPVAEVAPTPLSDGVAAASSAAARRLGYRQRTLPSGASHDTQMMTRICPTGMIFVPSRNHGISHAPDELSDADDIARGADVLIETLRELDAARVAPRRSA